MKVTQSCAVLGTIHPVIQCHICHSTFVLHFSQLLSGCNLGEAYLLVNVQSPGCEGHCLLQLYILF